MIGWVILAVVIVLAYVLMWSLCRMAGKTDEAMGIMDENEE